MKLAPRRGAGWSSGKSKICLFNHHKEKQKGNHNPNHPSHPSPTNINQFTKNLPLSLSSTHRASQSSPPHYIKIKDISCLSIFSRTSNFLALARISSRDFDLDCFVCVCQYLYQYITYYQNAFTNAIKLCICRRWSKFESRSSKGRRKNERGLVCLFFYLSHFRFAGTSHGICLEP